MTERADSRGPTAAPSKSNGLRDRHEQLDSLLVRQSAAPVREEVVARLRAAIVNQRFIPGQRLLEKEICELTGVSRTPVREALRQLESEGLVEVVPNRGPIVAMVTLADAQEIYELRMSLEGLIGRLFARKATAKEVAELRAAVDAIAQIDKSPAGKRQDLLTLKRRFYDILVNGAGNELARSSLARLHARVTALRITSLGQPGRLKHTVAELRAIIAAIEARDENAAEAACRAHVEAAARVAIAVMGGNPEHAFPNR